MTVLAAAGTFHLDASVAGSRPERVEIRLADQLEYARIEIEAPDHPRPDTSPARCAAPSAMRVTVTYLR